MPVGLRSSIGPSRIASRRIAGAKTLPGTAAASRNAWSAAASSSKVAGPDCRSSVAAVSRCAGACWKRRDAEEIVAVRLAFADGTGLVKHVDGQPRSVRIARGLSLIISMETAPAVTNPWNRRPVPGDWHRAGNPKCRGSRLLHLLRRGRTSRGLRRVFS